jgi:tetratricopeptide (TPR) repeat protein
MEAYRKLGEIQGKILIVAILVTFSSCGLRKTGVLSTTPPPDMLLLMEAKTELDRGNIHKAEDYINKFVELFPSHKNYSYVLYLKGEITYERGDFYTAYTFFKMAKKMIKDPKMLQEITRKIIELETILKIKGFASLFP